MMLDSSKVLTEVTEAVTLVTNIIDNSIQLISGRELVSSSEMTDILLDARIAISMVLINNHKLEVSQ